ncbi:MAG: hypothetical protein HY719_16235 [Planctomycetes bacterium]|nr:hypothetical protein [Planctomycetota bacterium]
MARISFALRGALLTAAAVAASPAMAVAGDKMAVTPTEGQRYVVTTSLDHPATKQDFVFEETVLKVDKGKKVAVERWFQKAEETATDEKGAAKKQTLACQGARVRIDAKGVTHLPTPECPREQWKSEKGEKSDAAGELKERALERPDLWFDEVFKGLDLGVQGEVPLSPFVLTNYIGDATAKGTVKLIYKGGGKFDVSGSMSLGEAKEQVKIDTLNGVVQFDPAAGRVTSAEFGCTLKVGDANVKAKRTWSVAGVEGTFRGSPIPGAGHFTDPISANTEIIYNLIRKPQKNTEEILGVSPDKAPGEEKGAGGGAQYTETYYGKGIVVLLDPANPAKRNQTGVKLCKEGAVNKEKMKGYALPLPFGVTWDDDKDAIGKKIGGVTAALGGSDKNILAYDLEMDGAKIRYRFAFLDESLKGFTTLTVQETPKETSKEGAK